MNGQTFGFKALGSAVLMAAWCQQALADAPNVATDIAPVQSLAAQVMAGVGSPRLIIQHGASPHDYQMRPSDASALQEADLVIWIGEELTPSLGRNLDVLAGSAAKLTLLDLSGTNILPSRNLPVFETDHEDDHHDDEHHDEHDEDKHHDEHDKDDHHDDKHHDENHDDEHHDEHDEDKHHDEHDKDAHHEDAHSDHAHAHEGDDPHVWLDPKNAYYWLGEIATKLAEIDPEHAAQYAANAAAAQADLAIVIDDIQKEIDASKIGRFIVYHDAYQYFEARFGITADGAIAPSDLQRPSAARLAALGEHLKEENVQCIYSEPQFQSGLISALQNDGGLAHYVIDPLGSALPTGADFYANLVRAVQASLQSCQ